jgi:hypothetical protein
VHAGGAYHFHWNDERSLEVAIAIARRRKVDMAAIQRWSEHAGSLARFERFRAAVRRRR